jgi:hypothetical protein
MAQLASYIHAIGFVTSVNASHARLWWLKTSETDLSRRYVTNDNGHHGNLKQKLPVTPSLSRDKPMT